VNLMAPRIRLICSAFSFSVLCACTACTGPAPIKTLSELQAEYRAKLVVVSRKPTAASAVAQAIERLAPDLDVSVKLYRELGRIRERGSDGMHVARTVDVQKRWVLDTLRRELAANATAFAEVRNARGLPGGLMPIDISEMANEANPIGKLGSKVRELARRLRNNVILSLSELEPRSALERVLDMVTLEMALRDTPSPVLQESRHVVQGLTNEAALALVATARLEPRELTRLADALAGQEVDEFRVLSIVMPIRRAYGLEVFTMMRAGDERLMAGIRHMLASEGDVEAPGASHILKGLCEDRKTYVEAFSRYEKAIALRKTLVDLPADKFGAVGKCVRPSLGAMQDRLRHGLALRRAAVLLVRALVFRSTEKRWPVPRELRVSRNPFQRARKVAIVVDGADARIGVYALRRVRRGVSTKVGYWLRVR